MINRDCRQCGEYIPYTVIILGKSRNLSARKYCLKCNPFKSGKKGNSTFQKTNNVVTSKFCSKCREIKTLDQFYKNKGKPYNLNSYCKLCQDRQIKERKDNLKRKAIIYMGGSCKKCGYKKNLAALVFHHKNPKEKDFKISGSKCCWEILKKELNKCELVCTNCHAEIHHPTPLGLS